MKLNLVKHMQQRQKRKKSVLTTPVRTMKVTIFLGWVPHKKKVCRISRVSLYFHVGFSL